MPGNVALPITQLISFLLVLARVSGAFAFVPIPGKQNIPGPAKVILVVSITTALAPMWPRMQWDGTASQIVMWVVREGAVGVAVGLVVAFLSEAILVCFQLLGLQAGYTFASTIDPVTQADAGVLQIFGQLAAGMLFFILGLDREMIRAFAMSLDRHPPGTLVVSPAFIDTVIKLGSNMLVIGMRLALPVVVALLLVDLAIALMGRVNAQIQLLTITFPAKMLTSLALSAMLLSALPRLYAEYAHSIISAVGALLTR